MQAQIDRQREEDEMRRLERDQAVEMKNQKLQEFERSKAEEQAKFLQRQKREKARRQVVLERVKEQDFLFRAYASQQLSKKVC